MIRRCDVLILTALPVEYAAVRHLLSNLHELIHPKGTIYEIGALEHLSVAIAQIGAGNEAAALEAERGIATLGPQAVVFVGVAGGLKDVAIGDVVVGTKIYGYESGKARSTFEPRPDVGQSSYRLVQRARLEAIRPDWRALTAFERKPAVYVAPIAAGEKVVASRRSQVFRFLRKSYGDAIAVEMEGRGLLVAAAANEGVLALVVRGISDLIGGKAAADASGSQARASAAAAAFAARVLVTSLRIEDSITAETPCDPGPPPVPEPPSQRSFNGPNSEHHGAKLSSATHALGASDAGERGVPGDPREVGEAHVVSWSGDGRLVATWPFNRHGGRVEVLDAATHTLIGALESSNGKPISGVAWSESGSVIAIGASDVVSVHVLPTMALRVRTGAIATYGQFALNRDGSRLLWGNVFGSTVLMNAGSGAEIHRAQLHSGVASLGTDVLWSPEGEYAAVSVERHSLQIWDGLTGALLSDLSGILRRTGADSDVARCCWARSGRQLIVATSDGTAVVADADQGWLCDTIAMGSSLSDPWMRAPPSLAVSDHHAAIWSDGKLVIYSIAGKRPIYEQGITPLAEYASGVELEFSHSGHHIAICSYVQAEILSIGSHIERVTVLPLATDGLPYLPRAAGWDLHDRFWVRQPDSVDSLLSVAGPRCCLSPPGHVVAARVNPQGTMIAIAAGGFTTSSLRTLPTYSAFRLDPGCPTSR